MVAVVTRFDSLRMETEHEY